MKLRLPSKLQAALIATLASAAFTTLSSGTIAVATGAALLAGQQAQAGSIDQNSTLNLDDNVLYNGYIYNFVPKSGSTQFHDGTLYKYVKKDGHMEQTSETTVWQSFANNQTPTYGHTLRLTSTATNSTVNTNFTPFSLGGLIVEAGAGTYTLGRANTATDFNGVGDVNMNIKGSITLLSNNGISFVKGGDWEVASGKTLKFQTNGTLSFAANQEFDLSGGGVVDMSTATNALTLNSGATINVSGGTTAKFATGAVLNGTIVNESGKVELSNASYAGADTARARGEGNGFGSTTMAVTSGVSGNGEWIVNGAQATYDSATGTVSGVSNSYTYYIFTTEDIGTVMGNNPSRLVVDLDTQDAVQNLGNNRLSGLNKLVVENGIASTAISSSNATGIVSGGTIVINGGGTFKVAGHHDAFGWGNTATKQIILTGTDADHLATLELASTTGGSATMATELTLNGYAHIKGGSFNTYGNTGNTSYITATGTNNVIDHMSMRRAVVVTVNENAGLNITTLDNATETETRNFTKAGAGALTVGTCTATFNNLTVSGGSMTTTAGATTIQGSLSVTGTNTLLTFGGKVTATGSYLDLGTTGTSGTEVDFLGGLDFTGTASKFNYAVVLGGNGVTMKLGGTSMLGADENNLKLFGIAKGTTLELVEGATATMAGVYGSGTEGNNGAIKVGSGATLNARGNVITTSLTNAGNLIVTGALTASAISGTGGTISATGGMNVGSGTYSGTLTTSTLTVKDGSTLTMDGGAVDVTNLAGAGTLAITPGTDATVTFNKTLTNAGKITLGGEGEIRLGNITGFTTFKEATEYTYSGDGTEKYNGSGFITGTNAQYYLIQGNGGTITGDIGIHGASRVTAGDGITDADYVFTVSGGEPLGTDYYVNSDLSYLENDKDPGMDTATAFIVKDGVTFSTTGGTINGRAVTLHNGSTLQNTANTWMNTAQITALTVEGENATATITPGGGNRISLQGINYSPVELMLNGNTLQVSGGGIFGIQGNTTVDNGTIALQGASVQVGNNQKTGISVDARNTLLTLAGGSSLVLSNSNSITLKGLNMVGDASASIGNDGTAGGNLTLTPGAGEHYTFKGTAQLKSLTLDGAADSSQTMNLTAAATLTTLTVNGGTLAIQGSALTTANLSNAGLISVEGASSSSLGKFTVTWGQAGQTLNMGDFALNNGEININSACESPVHRFNSITVDGAGKLTQTNWNNLMHIGALNDGTVDGARTFTWEMARNHFTNSVLFLDGAGTFSGTFTAQRNANGGHGAYQAHLEIGHRQALQNAVLDAIGADGSNYMSVALNADTVETAGLKGNAFSIIYAGPADTTIGSSGAGARGKIAPTSTGTSTLALNVAGATEYDFAGKVLGGISLVKNGAGTQTFSGDMSAFNGTLTVNAGTLKFTNAGGIGIASLSDLDAPAGTDTALEVTGTLTLTNDENYSMFSGNLALGGLELNGMLSIANITSLGSTIQMHGASSLLWLGDGTYNISGVEASSSQSVAPTASGYVHLSYDVQFINKNDGTFSTDKNLNIQYKGLTANTIAEDGSVHFEGDDYSTYYLKGEGDTLNLTQEQGDHPELQTVMVNASGSVSLSDTRSLQAVYQDADTVLTLTGGGELTVGSFGFRYGDYTCANISIDDGTTLKTGDLNVGEGETFTTGGAGTYIGGTLTVIDAGTTVNLGSHAELSSLSMHSGNVNISGETTVSGTTDLSNAASATGTVTVKETGTLNVNGSLWGRSASHLYLEQGGTVNIGSSLTIVGAAAGAELVAGTGDVQYSLDSGDWTIKNADTTITAAENQNITLANAISGNGSLVKLGAGTLTLTAANTFTGDLLISGGTVKVGNNSALGASGASHRIEVAANGTLDVNGSQGTNTEYTIVMNGGTLTNTEGTLGTNLRQVANHLVLEANSKVKAQNDFGLIAQGHNATSIEMGGHTLTIDGPSTFYVINATITGGGAIDVHSGTLNFNGAGSGRGTFASNFVLSGGTLSGNDLTLADDIYIDTQADSNMSLSVNRQGHAITFKGDADLTETSNLSGVGAIVKEGAGKLTLSGANTYSGTIALNGGALDLAGGSVNVSSEFMDNFVKFGDSEPRYSHDGYGFLISSAQYYLVKGTDGTTATKADGLAINGGSWVTPEGASSGDLVFTFDASEEDPHGMYYVNTSMATGDDTAMTSEKATGITIKEGAVLTASNGNAFTAPNKALHGAGTYALANGASTLNGNLSIGSDWTGVVRLSGQMTNLNISNLGTNIASTIEFAGVAGNNMYFAGHGGGIHTLNRDVIFTDVNNTSAVKLTNGYSAAGAYEFAGNVSGHGTFELNKSNVTYHFIFSGDVSDWDGQFKVTNASNNSDYGGTWVKFANKASVVNATINKVGGDLRVIADTDVAFSKAVTASALEVTAEHTARLGAALTVGGLTGPGDIISTAAITLNGDTGTTYEFGGDLTANSLKKAGAGTQTFNGNVTLNGLTFDNGGTSYFNGAVSVSGTERVNVYGSNVTFAEGIAYKGSNGFSLVVGNGNSDASLTLGADSSTNGKSIGVAARGTLTLEEGVSVSTSSVVNSSTFGSNGTVILKDSAGLNVTGAITAVTMQNAGTITSGGTITLKDLTNSGTINANSIVAYGNGTATNSGTIKVTGALQIGVKGQSSEDFRMTGGSLTAASLLTQWGGKSIEFQGGTVEFTPATAGADVITKGDATNGNSVAFIGTETESLVLKAAKAWTVDRTKYTTDAANGLNLGNLVVDAGNAGAITFKNAHSYTGSNTITNNMLLTLENFTVDTEETITLAGTGATTLSGNLTVNGSLTVGTGSNVTYTGSSAIANTGTITLNSDITATNLAVATNQNVYADLNGNLYANDSIGNYFAGTGADVITLATGSGSVAANGHRLTKDSVAYDIYANGLAAHFGEGGGVNYTTFYQNEGELNFSDIAKESAKHGGAQPNIVYTTDATLNVDANPVAIMLKNGTANFNDGVVITGGLYIEGEDIYGGEYSTVNGQVDIERVWFAQNGSSATLFDNSVIEKQGSGVRYSSDPEVGGIEIDADATTGNYYDRFSITNNRFVVSASEIAKVADGEITVGNGVDVDRVHNSADGITGKLTLDSGAYAATLKEVTATSGDIEFRHMAAANGTAAGSQTQVKLDNLYIGSSKTVSFYENGLVDAAEEAKVTVNTTLTASVGARLNADLEMATGSTLSVASGGLEMGSTVTLNQGMTLESWDSSLGLGDSYVLFTGVDGLNLGYGLVTREIGQGDWMEASQYFTNIENTDAVTYLLYYGGAPTTPEAAAEKGAVMSLQSNGSNVGVVYIYGVATPEPTTGTLSLLALAALAARRRRK
ncbi:MAG: autotransporter-associated beta strand repeat-containing protein [Akkermansia sp.]|nr:autotransporter-associated beta strand repeat-containing protein [Akkermansia sp.]